MSRNAFFLSVPESTVNVRMYVKSLCSQNVNVNSQDVSALHMTHPERPDYINRSYIKSCLQYLGCLVWSGQQGRPVGVKHHGQHRGKQKRKFSQRTSWNENRGKVTNVCGNREKI